MTSVALMYGGQSGFPFSRNKTKKASKKDILFIIGDWNAKVGSQETPGITSTFGIGVQNEAGQRLIEFWMLVFVEP